MDIDRITHPLRLAKGSHQPGSGKGCAMNVISYINGDAQITDFPACSDHPLTALVKSCDDLLRRPDGYPLPEDRPGPSHHGIRRCWPPHRQAALVVTDSIDRRSLRIPSSNESEGVRAGSFS